MYPKIFWTEHFSRQIFFDPIFLKQTCFEFLWDETFFVKTKFCGQNNFLHPKIFWTHNFFERYFLPLIFVTHNFFDQYFWTNFYMRPMLFLTQIVWAQNAIQSLRERPIFKLHKLYSTSFQTNVYLLHATSHCRLLLAACYLLLTTC